MRISTAFHEFTTPKGQPVGMTYRVDTSDWNTLFSCLNEDEYGLRALDLSGHALDIGAHIGGATLALLLDNPDLHVTSVEPVPENVALLRHNVENNGLQERWTLMAGAAGFREGTARIHYGYEGSETAEHHAFIGNISMYQGFGPDHCPVEIPHVHADVPIVTLKEIGPASFAKIDCEGGEWEFLRGDVSLVQRWAGEVHPTEGRKPVDIEPLFPGFDVSFNGDHIEAGPCGFVAVRR